jgi:hypothetical protein
MVPGFVRMPTVIVLAATDFEVVTSVVVLVLVIDTVWVEAPTSGVPVASRNTTVTVPTQLPTVFTESVNAALVCAAVFVDDRCISDVGADMLRIVHPFGVTLSAADAADGPTEFVDFTDTL